MIVDYGNNALIGFNSMHRDRTIAQHDSDFLSDFSRDLRASGKLLPLPVAQWMRFSDKQHIAPERCITGWHFENSLTDAFHNWHRVENILTMNLYGGLVDIGSPMRRPLETTKMSAEYRMCLGKINLTNLFMHDPTNIEMRTMEYSMIDRLSLRATLANHFADIVNTALTGARMVRYLSEQDFGQYGNFHHPLVHTAPNLFATFLANVIIKTYNTGLFPQKHDDMVGIWCEYDLAFNNYRRQYEEAIQDPNYTNIIGFEPELFVDFLNSFLPYIESHSNIRLSSWYLSRPISERFSKLPIIAQALFTQFAQMLWLVSSARAVSSQLDENNRAGYFIMSSISQVCEYFEDYSLEKYISNIINDRIVGIFHTILSEYTGKAVIMPGVQSILPDLTPENIRSIHAAIGDNEMIRESRSNPRVHCTHILGGFQHK